MPYNVQGIPQKGYVFVGAKIYSRPGIFYWGRAIAPPPPPPSSSPRIDATIKHRGPEIINLALMLL